MDFGIWLEEAEMLGALVVVYLFLGGCGAGILCATSLWSLAFHRTAARSKAQTDAFESIKARCYAAGFVVLVLAALCLLLDLGRPERFFMLYTRPTFSLLTFGSYILGASLLVSGFLAAVNLLYVSFVRVRAKKTAEVLCVVLSLCMMLYTGIYIACIEAVPLWNNAAIPVLFALSSVSAGLSAVFIVVSFVRDEQLLEKWTNLFHRTHAIVLAAEAFALVSFVGIAAADPFARASLEALLGSDGYGAWFLIGAVGMGVALPLIAEVGMALAGRVLRLLPIDVLCIAGGLMLRFCVVWSGMH